MKTNIDKSNFAKCILDNLYKFNMCKPFFKYRFQILKFKF